MTHDDLARMFQFRITGPAAVVQTAPANIALHPFDTNDTGPGLMIVGQYRETRPPTDGGNHGSIGAVMDEVDAHALLRIVLPEPLLHPIALVGDAARQRRDFLQRPPRRQVWFRAVSPLPDVPAIHRALLAYTSDFHLLETSLQPHELTWLTPGLQISSLDHAIWFHRPFRMDQWLLYDIDSPSARGARGLAHGRFFQDGQLVATTMQEGLIRDRNRGFEG